MDDYDYSEHATCHSVGIAGNCGPQCPVLVRGDCKEFDLDTNIQDVFENYDPEDAFEILSRYDLEKAVKYAIVNSLEIPPEYSDDISDMTVWIIKHAKNNHKDLTDVKVWEQLERLYLSFSVPPVEPERIPSITTDESEWAWCMQWCKLQGLSPSDSAIWNRARKAWKAVHIPTPLDASGLPKIGLGLSDPNRVDVPNLNFQIVDPYNKATKMNKKLFLL